MFRLTRTLIPALAIAAATALLAPVLAPASTPRGGTYVGSTTDGAPARLYVDTNNKVLGFFVRGLPRCNVAGKVTFYVAGMHVRRPTIADGRFTLRLKARGRLVVPGAVNKGGARTYRPASERVKVTGHFSPDGAVHGVLRQQISAGHGQVRCTRHVSYQADRP